MQEYFIMKSKQALISNQIKTKQWYQKQDIMKDYATLRPVSKSMKNLMDAKISIF